MITRYNEFFRINEAVSLYCPNCGENLGKDVENFGFVNCGTCGEEDIFNERGETEDMTESELKRWKAIKNKRKGGKLIRRW